MNSPSAYVYRGARAMVLLQEQHVRLFLETWRRAEASSLPLPATEDPDYASRAALLRHVLRASRGYLIWICKQLDLPDPQIDAVPEEAVVEARADGYLAHLLDRWDGPLRDVPEERFFHPEHLSAWNVRYCIDGMLEHAVMHPIRHRFQLEELLERGRQGTACASGWAGRRRGAT
ncbi:MAG: hypothetical protein V1774_04465 [Candidatus Eisenbacteria bacterium]